MGKSPNNCKCLFCGKEFYVKPFKIKTGRGKYCSLQCKYSAGYSQEICAKISIAHKGRIPWNIGISPSEETREKIRQANLGLKKPMWVRVKISKANRGINRGPKNGNWKGGEKRHGKYAYLTTPSGELIGEHRYVMEKFHNRKLRSDEVVHHINFIRSDNRIENLVVMSKFAHNTLHHKKH